MKDKKGASLALEVVIIAVIALLVLIVIIAIFAGKISIFGKGTTQQSDDYQSRVCATSGGTCMTQEQANTNCPNGVKDYKDWIDCGSGQVCCNGAT